MPIPDADDATVPSDSSPGVEEPSLLRGMSVPCGVREAARAESEGRGSIFGDLPKKSQGDLCPCVGDIGVIEMLVSSACCGIMYAVIGGSPLTILGGTGPILVFTGLLFKLAHSLEVEFLPFYAWTGVWIGVISIFLAAFVSTATSCGSSRADS